MKTNPASGHLPRNQSGVALPVVLLLLLIVTLLGLASMRGAIMEERMASNTAARSMAFQVAEAGLRQAEISVRDGSAITFPASGCDDKGHCAMVAPPAQPAWAATDFWTTANHIQGTPVELNDDLSVSPLYVIENFGSVSNVAGGGDDPIDMAKPPPAGGATQSVYRITSYALMPNGVEVTLQSLYRR